MSYSFRYPSILLLASLALAACGNKGPLVVPDKQPQAQPQQTSPPSAADAKPDDSPR
ncbi:MAG: LPS translocon maturation chaperone LptM [Rudaea sp.]